MRACWGARRNASAQIWESAARMRAMVCTEEAEGGATGTAEELRVGNREAGSPNARGRAPVLMQWDSSPKTLKARRKYLGPSCSEQVHLSEQQKR